MIFFNDFYCIMFTINYIKNKDVIFHTLDDITKMQNFIPLYTKFFSLNEKNKLYNGLYI